MRKVSGERHQLIYAHSLHSTEDLLDEMPHPSSNDFLRSVLINEGASEAMAAYYDGVRESDLLAWRNLLLYRRRWLKARLDRLPLDNIFTTGLPQEDMDRYRLS